MHKSRFLATYTTKLKPINFLLISAVVIVALVGIFLANNQLNFVHQAEVDNYCISRCHEQGYTDAVNCWSGDILAKVSTCCCSGYNWSNCTPQCGPQCEASGGTPYAGNGWCSCDCPGKPCYSNSDCLDSNSIIPASDQPKYCRFSDGNCSGPGECISNLALTGSVKCIRSNPVCGCDGKSYESSCDMEKANISLKKQGECDAPITCAEDGGYASLDSATGTRFGCCSGVGLTTSNGLLCFASNYSQPVCLYSGMANEGWYYANGPEGTNLLRLEDCSGE